MDPVHFMVVKDTKNLDKAETTSWMIQIQFGETYSWVSANISVAS